MGDKLALLRRVRFGSIASAVIAAGALCSATVAAQSASSAPVEEGKPVPRSHQVPAKAQVAVPSAHAPTKQTSPSVTKAEPTSSAPKTPAATAVGNKPDVSAPVSKAPTTPPAPAASVPTAPVVTQSSTEQAKLVYDQAVAAYEEHRYRDAIDLFQQADDLRPNPAFSFNIGTAYEDMGDSAMALLHYRAYLRQLPKAFDRDDVESRIRRLEGVLADKGLQQVTIISNPSEAMVVLDGKPRGVSPWTGEVAPGAHVVTLSLQGYADETRDFDLPSRRSIDVPVTLKRAEPKAAVPVIDLNKAPTPERTAPWEHVRPVTWGVLGVSAASFGAALGFELSRSALEQRAQRADSDSGRRRLHEDAQRSELWAKSFLMFAIGMGATTIVLAYQNIDDGLQAQANADDEGVAFGCTSLRDCGVSFSGSF